MPIRFIFLIVNVVRGKYLGYKEAYRICFPGNASFYMENVPVLNIVSSGFFDSIGLFRKCTERQQQVALAWMRVFGIEELKDRSFLTLSSGEQRLALLARAFVKDPDLIILDEPLHGLDVSNKRRWLPLSSSSVRVRERR